MPNGKKPKHCYTKERSPYWWYRFKIDGKEYRGSTRETEAKAAGEVVEALRVEVRKANQAGRDALGLVDGGKKQVTLKQCFAIFAVDRESGWDVASVSNRQRQSEYLLSLGDGPNMMVKDITLAHLNTYRRQRTAMSNRRKDAHGNAQTVSDATVNREVAHLKAAINHMKDYGFELPNINWAKAMRHEAETKRTRCLSDDEQRRLLKALWKRRPDLIPVVRFSIMSGQRQAAVLGLRWDMVDLDAGVATVQLKGKGHVKRLHTIALTKRMIAILRKQPKGSDYVFTYKCVKGREDADGKVIRKIGERYPFTKETIKKPWTEALNDAGVRDFRWHDLRHTAATRLIRATGNIQLVQNQLGHGDISTSARYANQDLEDLRRGMELAQRKRPHLRLVG